MRVVLIALSLSVALLWTSAAFAQQPRFPVDQNKLAVGVKEKTPEEQSK
jgi:hypothetical protein